MIDLHSHVLPGLDDGAQTLDESVEMARAAAEDGVTVLAGTPHVRDDYRTTPAQMEEALAAVRAAVAEAGIPVDVRGGGELAVDWLERFEPDELRRFGLGGNPRYLLVEFPYYGLRLDLGQKLFDLRTEGFVPVLAHPERNGELVADLGVLERLVGSGVLVQVTAASLDGRLGRRTQAAAKAVVERGLAHMVASDAHAPELRQIGMSAAARAVGDDALARWLTEEMPAAILADGPLPPRPEVQRRRRRWF